MNKHCQMEQSISLEMTTMTMTGLLLKLETCSQIICTLASWKELIIMDPNQKMKHQHLEQLHNNNKKLNLLKNSKKCNQWHKQHKLKTLKMTTAATAIPGLNVALKLDASKLATMRLEQESLKSTEKFALNSE